MVITETHSIIGGLLIGFSASLLMLSVGKICGLSGIFSAMITQFSERWRWVFFLGFLCGSFVMKLIGQTIIDHTDHSMTTSWAIISGLLVGAGTRLGGGCTSGHGICGLARVSTRSIVATIIFMSLAMITVYVRKNI